MSLEPCFEPPKARATERYPERSHARKIIGPIAGTDMHVPTAYDMQANMRRKIEAVLCVGEIAQGIGGAPGGEMTDAAHDGSGAREKFK